MSDEYQLRKDIDRLTFLVNELQKNQNNPNSDTNKSNQKLNDRLTGLYDGLTHFSTTLIKLRDNLIDFNQELIDFDEDNENFGEDLGQLKNNLHSFVEAVNSLSDNLSGLDDKLDELDGDIFGDDGLDKTLSALQDVVGDENGGLVKGLSDLDTSLGGLGKDVSGLGDSVTGLLSAVGDNNSGLVKSMNTLQTTVGDNNSGLVKQANDATSSIGQLNIDLGGLNRTLSSIQTTVGDDSDGLVKQMNDLSSSVSSLDNDVFGTNGLSSRLGDVEGSLSTVSSGLGTTSADLEKLVYSLDILSGYLTSFEGSLEDLEDELEDDPDIDTSKLSSDIVALFGAIGQVKSNVSTVEEDVYGDGQNKAGLLSDMSDAQQDIGSAQTSIGNVKTDLYGSSGTASSPQTGSLKKNLQTVQTTVGDSSSGLVKDLNTASGQINTVQTEMYGSNKNPNSPQAGSVVYNLNAIDTTINDEGGLIDQLGDVNDNIENVQGEVYGTDNQGTPLNSNNYSSTSLLGRADAVQEDIYGDGENKEGALSQIDTMQTVTIPAVNSTAQAAQTAANNVKTDLYGENGSASNYSSTSVKGYLQTIRTEDIPNVKTQIFGESTTQINCTNDWVQYTIDTSGLTGTGVIEFRAYPTSVIELRNIVGTGITDGAFTNNFQSWKRSDTTKITPYSYSGGKYARLTAPADSSAIVLSQENINYTNTDSITFYAKKGSPQDDTNQGNLVVFVGNKSDFAKGVLPVVENVVEDIDVAQGHIETFDVMLNGDENNVGLINEVGGVISEIGDTDTPNTILYNVDKTLTDIGDVTDFTGADISGALGSAQTDIQNVDVALTNMLSPSSTANLTYIYIVEDADSIVNSTISDLASKFGITIEWAYNYDNGNYYHKSGSNWGVDNGTSITAPMGVSNGVVPSIRYGTENFEYIYDVVYKRYYYHYVDPNNSSLGYYGEWRVLDGIPDFFDQTELYKAVESKFSKLTHTHIKTNITDFSHTHPFSEITNVPSFPPTPSQSFQLLFGQEMLGVRVVVYSDGFNVFVSVSGTFNGSNSVPSGGNIGSIGTLTNSKYAPPHPIQTPIHTSNNYHKLILNTNGQIDFLNPTSNKSLSVDCSVYYPLKNRMPSFNVFTSKELNMIGNNENYEIYVKTNHSQDTTIRFFAKEE